jgi:hypothetical protein
MTVTLIEGENFTVTEANTFTNPFVVFTCNGKRRTSSVKLRTPNPNWCGMRLNPEPDLWPLPICAMLLFDFSTSFHHLVDFFSCLILMSTLVPCNPLNLVF